MKRKALFTTYIAITLMLVVTPQAESKDKDAGQVKEKSPAANLAQLIPWPFTINQQGYKIIKGKWIQWGQAVPPGTSVTFEGSDKDDAGHHFVAQLVANRWTIAKLPSQKGKLWEKVATKGPWEATIASEPTKTASATEPQTDKSGGTKTGSVFKLWRTRLEVRLAKNYDATKPPFEEEIRQPPPR